MFRPAYKQRPHWCRHVTEIVNHTDGTTYSGLPMNSGHISTVRIVMPQNTRGVITSETCSRKGAHTRLLCSKFPLRRCLELYEANQNRNRERLFTKGNLRTIQLCVITHMPDRKLRIHGVRQYTVTSVGISHELFVMVFR